jgi:acyl phosphate:glycerol-3-phosphate acyltransferase
MIIFLCMFAYIIGTLQSGIICAKIFKLGDLRQIGSGNTGATNVLRTGNKFAAFLTLLLDALKGTIAVLLWHIGHYVGIEFNETHAVIFGGCAFLGHVFPIWSGFKGGKGVATYLGLLFGLNFMFGIFACMLWLIGAFLSKISSIGALNMALLMPLLLYVGQENNLIAMIMVLLSCILIVKHKANIQRIIQKTEPKIGQK